MAGDWSELLPELLRIISSKLTMYKDYLRFRSVCRKWRSSAPKRLPCELPWLMLPQSRPELGQSRRAFFSLSGNSYHFFYVPDAASRHRRRRGSSLGWIAILDETPNIYLVNPLTRGKFPLPPLSAFPSVLAFDFAHVGREYTLRWPNHDAVKYDLKRMRDSFIKKLVLSSSPASGGDFVALMVLNQAGDLAFCRRDDRSWGSIEGTEAYSEDAIFHNGLFYAVNKTGRIAVCDVSNSSSPRVWVMETPPQLGGDMQYLVSCSGDLLLVTRYLESEFDAEAYQIEAAYRTKRFEVFRLESREVRWKRVHSLGDWALFLGENSSVSILAKDFDGCKGNCIYYTDDHTEFEYESCWVDLDLGIFNLGDCSIEPLPCYPRNQQPGLHWPPPLWVTPNPW